MLTKVLLLVALSTFSLFNLFVAAQTNDGNKLMDEIILKIRQDYQKVEPFLVKTAKYALSIDQSGVNKNDDLRNCSFNGFSNLARLSNFTLIQVGEKKQFLGKLGLPSLSGTCKALLSENLALSVAFASDSIPINALLEVNAEGKVSKATFEFETLASKVSIVAKESETGRVMTTEKIGTLPAKILEAVLEEIVSERLGI